MACIYIFYVDGKTEDKQIPDVLAYDMAKHYRKKEEVKKVEIVE